MTVADEIRVFLVEDDARLRRSLCLLLDGTPGMRVAGDAGSAEEALSLLAELRPSLAIVDLGLPGMTGVELIRALKRLLPDLEIMAHTVYEDRGRVLAAIKAGATSYLLKGSSPRELIEAVQELAAGGAPMSPKIARAIMRELQGSDEPRDDELLTSREREVLHAIEAGETYKEVALRLGIGINTVHTHIKHIYEKLDAGSRREALSKARRKGLI